MNIKLIPGLLLHKRLRAGADRHRRPGQQFLITAQYVYPAPPAAAPLTCCQCELMEMFSDFRVTCVFTVSRRGCNTRLACTKSILQCSGLFEACMCKQMLNIEGQVCVSSLPFAAARCKSTFCMDLIHSARMKLLLFVLIHYCKNAFIRVDTWFIGFD